MSATASTQQLPPLIEGSKHIVLLTPHEEGLRQAEAMETWFQACSTDTPFSLELVATPRQQGFILRASSQEQLILLGKQFEAQYPQTVIEKIAAHADPLVLHTQEHALIGTLAMQAPAWLPLKTFTGKALAEPGTDPLAGILAAMEALQPGERVICQLALVRAPGSWIAGHMRKAIENPLQQERDRASMHRAQQDPDTHAVPLRILLILGTLLLLIFGARWLREGSWLPLSLLGIAALVGLIGYCWWQVHQDNQPLYDPKLVAEKLKRAAFHTSLRIIVIGTSSDKTRLRIVLDRLEIAYRQFTLTSANSLALTHVQHVTSTQPRARRISDAAFAFPYHHHPLLRLIHGGPSKDVWNALELSGAFHLPQETADFPLVKRLSVKHLLFPPELAYEIAHTPASLPPVLLGHSTHRGHVVEVQLPFSTLFSHKFLVGRSRSGKSVLMQLMIAGAMQPVVDHSLQPGVFVIDPHHDLVEDLLKLIPSTRFADVLLLDFTDTNFPIGLNPLDATMGFSRDQAVSNLMACFEQVWSAYWGPRMSYFLKSVCLLLYTLNVQLVGQGRAAEQYTILDINPLLQYQDYARQALQSLDRSEPWHQELLAWWKNVYFTMPKQSSFRQEVIMPILSKMGTFQDNQILRRVVGQSITTAPIHEAITHGKIVLCGLSSRDLDDASVNVLGSTLINLLHRSFTLQQATPLLQRRKVLVACDELQNFSGGFFNKLLSEDAKFGCAMLLSTQNLKRLTQIKEGLLEDVLTNCENLWTFNVAAADAKILEQEMKEKITQKHILSLSRLQCYARMSFPDHPLHYVSMRVAQPASWQHTTMQQQGVLQLRMLAQRHHAPLAQVDALYAQHLQQYLHIDQFADTLDREVQATQKVQAEQVAAQENATYVQMAQQGKEGGSPGGYVMPPTYQGGKHAISTQQGAGNGSSTPQGGKGRRNHSRNNRASALQAPQGKTSLGSPAGEQQKPAGG